MPSVIILSQSHAHTTIPALEKLRDPALSLRKRSEVEELTSALYSASWIWAAENSSLIAPPRAERAFRIHLATPNEKQAISALIVVSVDDNYSLYVNGYLIGGSSDWTIAKIYNVTLEPASNVLAIRGLNFPQGQGPAPAGILAAIRITFSDGTTSTLTSDDGQWRASKELPYGFERPFFNDSSWAPPALGFKYGDGPRGTGVSTVPDTILQIALPHLSSTIPVSTSPLPQVTTKNGTIKRVGIIVGVLGGTILLLLVLALLWRYRRRRHTSRDLSVQVHVAPFNIRQNNHLGPIGWLGPENAAPQRKSLIAILP